MWLKVDLSKFILPGVFWDSWICRLMFFTKFGQDQQLFSQVFFNPFLSPFPLWLSFCIYIGYTYTYIGMHIHSIDFWGTIYSPPLFFFLFLSLGNLNKLSLSSVFLSSVSSNMLWASLANFSFQFFNFQFQKPYLVLSFKIISMFLLMLSAWWNILIYLDILSLCSFKVLVL